MDKLIYVDDSLPGITRKGAGTGFAYYSPAGDLIRDTAERKRLNAIALPPAYHDAWFCPASNGHILATGYDEAGRKQYRYHPDFRRMREGEKFDACQRFGRMLPLIRKRVDEDLSRRQMTRERALASVVRLLDLSAIRIGNDHYARTNASYGATTLQNEHVEVGADQLHLHFDGKGGQERDITLEDARLARAVAKMEDLGGKRLFKFVDDIDGAHHPVTSDMVNDYLRDTMGSAFTAKHFRTWHASVIAFRELIEGEGELPIRALLEVVAEHLGNTPAIARKSYIHPVVIARVEGQCEWRNMFALPRATRWMSRHERGLLKLLDASGDAAELLAA